MSYLNCITGNGGVGSRGKRRIPERLAKPNWEGSSKSGTSDKTDMAKRKLNDWMKPRQVGEDMP